MAFKGAFMRKALDNGNVVDQFLGNAVAPYQTITFNEAIYDTDGYWNSSRNCFEIPAGVSYVRFSGQAVFHTNGYGFRQILVQRSDPGSTTFKFYMGSPIHNTTAIAGTTTDIAITSPITPVVEGECYALQPYQNSGSTIRISGGVGTFFAMEVIE